MPGGTAFGAALPVPAPHPAGGPGADAGFALAMQGVGSAVVLNVDLLAGPARVAVLPRLQPALRRGGRRRSRCSWASFAGVVVLAHPGPRHGRRDRPPLGRPRSRSSTARSSPSGSSASPSGCAVPGRATGLAAAPGHRVGGGVLAARRRLSVRVHRRLPRLRLARRPPGRLRPGPHPGRHPDHARRASASSRRSSSPPCTASASPCESPSSASSATAWSTSGCPSRSAASPTCRCGSRARAGASACARSATRCRSRPTRTPVPSDDPVAAIAPSTHRRGRPRPSAPSDGAGGRRNPAPRRHRAVRHRRAARGTLAAGSRPRPARRRRARP